MTYILDRERVADILQKEFTRHTQEIKRHREEYKIRKSKRQRRDILKHMHKRYQTGLIAKSMGFKICGCCGRIY